MPADCFRKIIRRECRETPRPDGSVVLRERQGAGKMEVNVSGLGHNAVVIRLDQKGQKEQGGQGEYQLIPPRGIEDGPWKKRCDYLIVRQDKRRVRVLFVELKSNMNRVLEGCEQLRRSSPLFEYLRAMCRVENSNSLGKYEVRYVLLAEKGDELFAKRTTIHKPIRKKRHGEIDVSCYHCPDGRPVSFDRLWQ